MSFVLGTTALLVGALVLLPAADARVMQQDRIPIKPARLEFRFIAQFDDGTWRHEPERDRSGKETGYEVIRDRNGKLVPEKVLNRRVFKNDRTLVVSGRDLEPACRAEISDQRWIGITFSFRGRGRRALQEFTSNHIGKPLALFIDRRLITAPTINGAIPGKGVIQGRFTADQARILAKRLNAGAGR